MFILWDFQKEKCVKLCRLSSTLHLLDTESESYLTQRNGNIDILHILLCILIYAYLFEFYLKIFVTAKIRTLGRHDKKALWYFCIAQLCKANSPWYGKNKFRMK